MTRACVFAGVLLAALGCGSEPEPERVQSRATTGAERADERGMDVSGLMGTIPERKILSTLEPKLPRFQRCFFEGSSEVEFIGGAIEFYFRVGLDGGVEWVFLRKSDVGHRATERCLLDQAARARFPEPQGGGAAEFAWGFALDPLDGVRPPVAWDAERVVEALREGSEAFGQCGPGPYVVTAYVAPGGGVLGAGAAAGSYEASQQVDCVVEVVRGLSMPDPGSYAAKVTFTVP